MSRILAAAPQAWHPGTVNRTILISARAFAENEISSKRHSNAAIIFFIANLNYYLI